MEGTWIVREGGRYFVIIPQKRHYQAPENQRIDAVALDPGIRTFQAFYSEVMKCDGGANVDRDLNGARGIFLRALAVTP